MYDHPLTRRALLLGAAAGVAALAEGCTANPTGPPPGLVHHAADAASE